MILDENERLPSISDQTSLKTSSSWNGFRLDWLSIMDTLLIVANLKFPIIEKSG